MKRWRNAKRPPSVGDHRCEILAPSTKICEISMLRHWAFWWRYDLAARTLRVSWIAIHIFLRSLWERNVHPRIRRSRWVEPSPSFKRSSLLIIQFSLFHSGNNELTWERTINDLFRPEFLNRKYIAQRSNDRRERYNSSYTITPAVKLRITVLYTFTATVCM